MSSDQQYLHGSFEWHPQTPQSAKFAQYPFQSPAPSQFSPIPFGLDWSSQGTYNASQAPATYPVKSQSNATKSSGIKRPRQPSQSGFDLQSPTKQGVNRPDTMNSGYQQMSFPTNSFLQQFDGANLEDPFTTMQQEPLPSQMQTPPPTRDANGKRKPQQPVMDFGTPSTIISRRMSVPSQGWNGGAVEASMPEASPFTFTPLQFSPPTTMQFSNVGPATAPAYPQGGLLWDPNSNMDLSFQGVPTISEDPFVATTSAQPNLILPSQRPRAYSSMFPKPTHSVSSTARPQSAQPAATTSGSNSMSTSSLPIDTSVDPSLIWMDGPVSSLNSSLPRTKSFPAPQPPPNAQPYQYHLDELKREKEHERQRRASQHQVRTSSAHLNLRRSLTDTRSRKTKSGSHISGHSATSSTSSDLQEITHGLRDAHLPRTSSPLKRHKPDGHSQKSQPRRSVVLTVDDKGRARTEVRTIPDGSSKRQDWRNSSVLNDDDDESDSSDLPESPAHSRNSSSIGLPDRRPSPAKSDAQSALRQVVMEKQQKRQEQGNSMHSGSRLSIPNNSSLAMPPPPPPMLMGMGNQQAYNHNSSPTTISDPDMYTPTSDPSASPQDGTRCVCNNNPQNDNQMMIQCESCLKWLHIGCVGLNAHNLPAAFLCIHCTGPTPYARRSGRMVSYHGMESGSSPLAERSFQYR